MVSILRRIRKLILMLPVFFFTPVFSSEILCQNLFIHDPIKQLADQAFKQFQHDILGSSLYEPLTSSQLRYLDGMLDFRPMDPSDKQYLRVREWEELYIAERHFSDALGLLYDPYWRKVRDMIFIQWVRAGMADHLFQFFNVIPPSLDQIYLVRKNMNLFLQNMRSVRVVEKNQMKSYLKMSKWLLETEMNERLDLEYQLMEEGALRPEWPSFVFYLVQHILLRDIDRSDCQSTLKRLTARLRPIQYQLPEVRSALVGGMYSVFELLQREDLKKRERLSLHQFLQEWILSLPTGSFQNSVSPLESLKKSANLNQDLVSRIEKLQEWFEQKNKVIDEGKKLENIENKGFH